MKTKYSHLVEEIDKKEEFKEENVNFENALQFLKAAINDLQDKVAKVEEASKEGADMVIAMNAATDSMDTAVFAFCRAVTRAEGTVLKVEMTDECKKEIISAREKLIETEKAILTWHRTTMLQQIRSQNEEMQSFIKSAQGVYLSPRVFWWWAGISYVASLYSLWNLLQLLLHWLK